MDYLDEAVSQIENFEGRIPWMYLDSEGNVTAGVGILIPNQFAAVSMHFQVDSVAATVEEIGDDYERVKVMPIGFAAAHYRCPTSPLLPDSEMDALLRTFVVHVNQSLPAVYPKYSSWPVAAKLGILDMAYNLGIPKLRNKYPAFNRGANADPPNWHTAALNCGRNTSNPAFNERNRWARNQFESCIQA